MAKYTARLLKTGAILSLKSTATTSLDFSARPPASPLPATPTTPLSLRGGPTSLDCAEARPLICPTCAHDHSQPLYTAEGRHRAALCSECFYQFWTLEKAERKKPSLTSFPSLLLESERGVGAQQEDTGGEQEGREALKVSGTWGSVFGGWFGRSKRRPSSLSERSFGSPVGSF